MFKRWTYFILILVIFLLSTTVFADAQSESMDKKNNVKFQDQVTYQIVIVVFNCNCIDKAYYSRYILID